VLHLPAQPATRGVIVVVGGPQTRVGSHRQFVLLWRMLVAKGILVLRFDYRSMGDSEGTLYGFEHIKEDILVTVDTIFSLVDDLGVVVLWGLCNGATVTGFYTAADTSCIRIGNSLLCAMRKHKKLHKTYDSRIQLYIACR